MTPATSTASPSTRNRRWYRHPLAITCFALLIGVHLLFTPLVLALLEHWALGTDHVEDFCRTLGIHGFLSAIYRPVIGFLDL
ncbi:hypothetical protein Pan189_30470 [Stratiformator vulcanicus]|uniref:Uncharacterized protein n=1 Tax=Stratiformator vulcanicus TaxID=2527980 RepID=A0A517R432_9PLAN|nr:hypothetical protein Pan189_30470 [Stratiformator vulcanicus]